MIWFYRMMSKIYDLIDVIYFRNIQKSPRKVTLDRIDENDRVLDVCTGTATNAIAIASQKKGTKVFGIDLSSNMLKVGREKIKKRNLLNVRLYQMDATKLKFKNNSFDKILISLVLHEVNEELASKILKEVKRVLKPDGEIIITEWEPSRQFSKKILFAPIHFMEPKSYREFIKKDLDEYFGKYGLSINKTVHCDYSKVIVLQIKKDAAS